MPRSPTPAEEEEKEIGRADGRRIKAPGCWRRLVCYFGPAPTAIKWVDVEMYSTSSATTGVL